MNTKIKQTLFLIIAIGMAVFFVSITLNKVDFENVKNVLRQTNFFWIILSMILSVVGYWIRAARWNLLLHPMGYKTKIINGFWSLSITYFMNLTIPRTGEVARATTLYKLEKVPFEKGFGSVLLERIIDLICLIIVFGLSIIFNYEWLLKFNDFFIERKTNASVGNSESNNIYYIIGIVCLIFIFLTIIFLKRSNISPILKKVKAFFIGLKEGILSILKLKKRSLFVGYTIALWVCYFLMTYVVFFSFPDTKHYGISEGLFLLVAGSIGMILPVSGGLAYPFVMSVAFAAMYSAKGLDAKTGESVGDYFGLILYMAQITSIIICGLIAIYVVSKTKKVDDNRIS